jgi:hypothetical protein
MAKRSDTAAAPATPISNADEITPQRFVLTAALADLAKQQREAVQEFVLPATAKGAFARVRVPDLGDPDVLMALPDTLLRQILKVVNDVETNEGRIAAVDLSKPDEVDLVAAKHNAMRQRAIVDAYCIAGFVEPPLAMTEDEQTTTAHVLISAIHPSDRIAFFNWCQGQHTEATATAAEFPDGSPESVATGGPSGMPESTERTASAA